MAAQATEVSWSAWAHSQPISAIQVQRDTRTATAIAAIGTPAPVGSRRCRRPPAARLNTAGSSSRELMPIAQARIAAGDGVVARRARPRVA